MTEGKRGCVNWKRSSRSHFLENLLWKKLWTCLKTDNKMNVVAASATRWPLVWRKLTGCVWYRPGLFNFFRLAHQYRNIKHKLIPLGIENINSNVYFQYRGLPALYPWLASRKYSNLQTSKTTKCGNFKFRICCFSNLTRLDDGEESLYLQSNNEIVYSMHCINNFNYISMHLKQF
jgi:hypothetical protein